MVTEPYELTRAKMLDAVCRRWPGYTLSSALNENAELLLSTLELLRLGGLMDE
jgi:hypothetical protein